MQRQDSFNQPWLARYVEVETEHIDLVASWERLVSIYEQMHFIDEITDSIRIEEFKWIIREMNKFLTRARNGLAQSVKRNDWQTAIDYLMSQITIKDTSNVDTRKALVYMKLKQEWVYRLANRIHEAGTIAEKNELEEENQDG